MRIIALEEHFTTPELAANSAATAAIAQPGIWAAALEQMLEVGEGRLAAMDAAGLDVQVLSLNSPGIQGETDAVAAVDRAKAVNDLLAATIETHPNRYSGFAALPLQDPASAARELERAVTRLGLKGGLVNGHTQGRYLDDPTFRIVWETASRLDVPIYLHPANSVDVPDILSGHPVLAGPMWSWGGDTATHVLRLVFGGVFDEFPDAKIIIGHMGEGLPYGLWRLDSRWAWHNHRGVKLRRENPSDYIRHNVYITTSGVCDEAPLACAIKALGPDHVLFGADYPFEDLNLATEFLRGADIDQGHRDLVAHGNAERLLRL
jgi:2,3-dihydroxybenzoate decarboxylase